jgi:hypothetical protein
VSGDARKDLCGMLIGREIVDDACLRGAPLLWMGDGGCVELCLTKGFRESRF